MSNLFKRHKRTVKAGLQQVRRRFVRAFLSYDEHRLLACLQALGVRHGDSIMLHSGFAEHHGFRGSIDALTRVFIDAIGPEGNLLMVSLPYRSSTIEYLKSAKPFDVRRTVSMMGMVSELFRRRPDVVRSLHPTHPVLARGQKADWFVAGHEHCRYPCGPGTPFEKMVLADGIAVFFNVPLATYTMVHYLEHLLSPRLPFPLYMDEAFRVPVIDAQGERRMVETVVFAPGAIARRRFPVFEQALGKRGLIREQRVGNSRIIAVRVRDTVECMLEMERNGESFYEVGDLLAHPRISQH